MTPQGQVSAPCRCPDPPRGYPQCAPALPMQQREVVFTQPRASDIGAGLSPCPDNGSSAGGHPIMTLSTLAASSGRNSWDILGRFDKLSGAPVPAWVLVVALWALFVFPGIGIRSFHYEEGYIVAVARGAIEDGYWLTPHLYGWRFVERPNLMAWTVALIVAPFGGPNQWLTRAPAVLSLLGSALLIYWLVRRHASALAALFAAVSFIASPMMLQKVVTAEPDVMVAFLLFAAFIVW